MKIFLLFTLLFTVISLIYALATLEKVDVKILDPKKGSCVVTILPGPPKTVDINVESFGEFGYLKLFLVSRRVHL